MLMADIAHIAGLIAAGAHPNPVPYCDVVTSTTHKTLTGPRAGIIMCRAEYAEAIDRAVFPGMQGGPLMHVIAAKAVCLRIAQSDEFHKLQRQIVKNCAVLAETLAEGGLRLVSGGTDVHLALVDLRPAGITGLECQELLERVNITANRNVVPFEEASFNVASGLRVGSPAVSTRGFMEPEMRQTGELMLRAIADARQRRRAGARSATRWSSCSTGSRCTSSCERQAVGAEGTAGTGDALAVPAELGRVLPPARHPGGDALHLSAPPGRRRPRARQAHPRDRLQRRPARRLPLPGHRLPARAAGHPVGRAPGAVPRHPRRAERGHPGRHPRRRHRGRDAVHARCTRASSAPRSSSTAGCARSTTSRATRTSCRARCSPRPGSSCSRRNCHRRAAEPLQPAAHGDPGLPHRGAHRVRAHAADGPAGPPHRGRRHAHRRPAHARAGDAAARRPRPCTSAG